MSRVTPAIAVVSAVVGVLAVTTILIVAVDNDGKRPVRTTLTVAGALSSDTTGSSARYARALEPRTFRFPEDHGPHPDFRTEWWYYTGNLSTPTGRRFGYQFTIFRTALSPSEPPPDSTSRAWQAADSTWNGRPAVDSTWRTRQLYMGHLALSDEQDDAFYAFERFSRGAAGLAGASAQPYHVWLDDWSVAGTTADSVRLRAVEQDLSIDLWLQRAKPIVLQGDGGLDRKGPEPGNASYYYSMTRIRSAGTITIRGLPYEVEGLSWLDREWSTSALGEDQVGWDWFSLQLDDGRDLMFYRLRRSDGTASPFSNGVVVEQDGTVRRLSQRDVVLEATRSWESPASGSRYPVGWSFRIPSTDVDLVLEPYLDEQELNLAVTYWEGAVRITGSHRGSGYVEMTGYDQSTEGGE